MKKPNLSEMTLKEKIGQLILPNQWEIYQDHTKNYEVNRTEEEWRQVIAEYQFGSYWSEQIGSCNKFTVDLAGGGLDQKVHGAEYRKFLARQDQCGKIPALFTTDSERGASGFIKELSTICPPMAVTATGSEELAFQQGVCIARELRSAGINWRWAPVVDIAHHQNICYYRSFSPDHPDKMIQMANAHIRGMQSEGVAATAKHFPGADRYDYRDSHFSHSIISSSMEQWWAEQGKIFQSVIDNGVYSVMIGHVAFPAWDDSVIKGEYRPATVSKKIITDLLKGEMGFDGVVVTDSVAMAGITSFYDTYEEEIVDLVNAGNDVLLGVRLPACDIVEQAVKDGRIPESRIDDACQRVLNMKEKLGMFEEGYWDLPYTLEEAVAETQKLNLEIARRSITKVHDRQGLLPVDSSKVKNVTIICSTHTDRFFDELQHMKKCFEDRGIHVRLQRRLSGHFEMVEIAESSDLIIYAAYVAPHMPKGGMTLYGDECNTYLYAFSQGNGKSIGASFGYPLLHFFPMGGANTFINAYSESPESMQAFVEAIFGEIPITGKSPVKLYPDHIIPGPSTD